MKKNRIIILISIFVLSLNFVEPISAKELVEPRSVETLLATGQIQLSQGGSNRGYVDCFVKVDYNIQAKTYKVVAAYVQPHIFNSPFLLVGRVTSDPAVGQYFSKGTAIYVNFLAGEGSSLTQWNYRCRVSF